HDAPERLTVQNLPTGPSSTVTTARSYSTAGMLTSLISKKAGMAFDSHSYERDNIGNITQETVNGQTNAFGYDDLYRLTSSSVGGVSSSWSYDKVGNRLSQAVAGTTTNYTYDAADRLLTVNGATV